MSIATLFSRSVAVGLMVLVGACASVSQDLTFDATSDQGLVLVAGLDLGRFKDGAILTEFSIANAAFGSTVITIDRQAFASDEVRIKDDDGASTLTRQYFIHQAKPGNYVWTTEVRPDTQIIGDPPQAVNARQYLCRRSGGVFPVLPGKVTLIDLKNPQPTEEQIADYRRDFDQITAQYPNVSAPLFISSALGDVEFFGENTSSLVTIDLTACPTGVAGFRPKASALTEN